MLRINAQTVVATMQDEQLSIAPIGKTEPTDRRYSVGVHLLTHKERVRVAIAVSRRTEVPAPRLRVDACVSEEWYSMSH